MLEMAQSLGCLIITVWLVNQYLKLEIFNILNPNIQTKNKTSNNNKKKNQQSQIQEQTS